MTDRFAGLPPQYKERIEKLESFSYVATQILDGKVKRIVPNLDCIFVPEQELICIARLKEEEGRNWVVCVAIKITSRKIIYAANAEELEPYGEKDLTDEVLSEVKKVAKEFVASFADWPLLD